MQNQTETKKKGLLEKWVITTEQSLGIGKLIFDTKQGCQIFVVQYTKTGKIYQMAGKLTKWP
jgi:hypothetical protein